MCYVCEVVDGGIRGVDLEVVSRCERCVVVLGYEYDWGIEEYVEVRLS